MTLKLILTALVSSILLMIPPAAGAQVIPGQYIITMKDGLSPDDAIKMHQLKPAHVYRHAINGFAAKVPAALVTQLLNDPRVLRVEPDQIVSTGELQTGAPWGLDRIDQRYLPLDGFYGYLNDGAGVTAYIIDGGIRYSHVEFGGRARPGFDAFGGDGSDCYGHGTHVAAILGGATHGVAKNVNLVSIKVTGCTNSGAASDLIAGINWLIGNRTLPAVANISLYSGGNASLDDAVRNLIASGVATAVCAGNNNMDASNFSPARLPEAMTIAAVDAADARATFSNYGSSIDWFAPGVSIPSASFVDDTSFKLMTGTSMATPHAAGVAALYLQNHPSATPQELRDALFSFTTKNVITSSLSANQHLLVNYEDVMVGPQLQPPSVAITNPANGTTVARNTTLTLKANASDSDGTITTVAFYVNRQLLCADNTAPYTCSFKTAPQRGVSYSIHAVATDNHGLVTQSTVVSVTTK